jgi:Zn-dependent peptidase ImmA (M78 family)
VSLWDFIEDIVSTTTLTQQDLRLISNPASKGISHVAFLENEEIETFAASALSAVGYSDGEVSLPAICEQQRERNGLTVVESNTDNDMSRCVLGKISFNPLEIHIFRESISHRGRERFTLAHELGHLFLQHSRYMRSEIVQTKDLDLNSTQRMLPVDVQRMEWQANCFASCLLLPKLNLIRELVWQLHKRDIKDKQFGALFVDGQQDNIQNYYNVTNALKLKFGVSRSVVRHRLIKLGFLKDVRTTSNSSTSIGDSIGSLLG